MMNPGNALQQIFGDVQPSVVRTETTLKQQTNLLDLIRVGTFGRQLQFSQAGPLSEAMHSLQKKSISLSPINRPRNLLRTPD